MLKNQFVSDYNIDITEILNSVELSYLMSILLISVFL